MDKALAGPTVEAGLETSPGLDYVIQSHLAQLTGWGKKPTGVLADLLEQGLIQMPAAPAIEVAKAWAPGTELCINCGDIWKMSRRRDRKPRCRKCGTLAQPMPIA